MFSGEAELQLSLISWAFFKKMKFPPPDGSLPDTKNRRALYGIATFRRRNVRTLAENVWELKWNGVGLVKQQEDVEFHLLKLSPASKNSPGNRLFAAFLQGQAI